MMINYYHNNENNDKYSNQLEISGNKDDNGDDNSE